MVGLAAKGKVGGAQTEIQQVCELVDTQTGVQGGKYVCSQLPSCNLESQGDGHICEEGNDVERDQQIIRLPDLSTDESNKVQRVADKGGGRVDKREAKPG